MFRRAPVRSPRPRTSIFRSRFRKILYLRVGTGSAYTTGALTSDNTVDQIIFTPAAAVVGNGTAVAAASGGDAGAASRPRPS